MLLYRHEGSGSPQGNKDIFWTICNGSNPVKNRREKQKTPRSGQEHIIYSQTI